MANDPTGSRPTRKSLTSPRPPGTVVLRVDPAGLVDSVDDHLGLFPAPASLLGKPLPTVPIDLAAAVGPGQPAVTELHLDRPSMWIEIASYPTDAGGALLVLRDVTARRQHDEDCARLRLAADAKDEFLALLTHELRTPLAPVLMAANLLETDATLPAQAREEAAVIRRNVELEARLIDDLLDLNRLAIGKMPLRLRTVDVHSVIGHALHVARDDVLAKHLWLRMDLAATRHAARADPVRLQQILWNLIRNAVRFTPDRGTVIVRTRDAEDSRIRIEIQDTGVGIEPEALARIFSAFDQSGGAREPGRLGLGLAICRALVELHGGRVWAESAGPGRGATFAVELPALAVVPAAVTPPPAAGVDVARKLAILVVDDHVSTIEMLARVLTKLGHDVATATTLGDASSAADARHFDLLIADLGLPDGSGLDLMTRLREHDPALRGIALSGYGLDGDRRRSLSAGFAAHLTKPVAIADLESAIARVTGQSSS